MRSNPTSEQGYWKPCASAATGNGESWWPEIISFYIDRLGGFYHTPAVVPVAYSATELRNIGYRSQCMLQLLSLRTSAA
jgi:hypothetical protein